MAPVIAIIQTVIDVKYKAVSVGVFFFATAMAQTVSTVVMGQLEDRLDLDNPANIETLGIVMVFNTALPCFLAGFAFHMSGPYYVV